MGDCAHCGHPLPPGGAGRFCSHCGHAVDAGGAGGAGDVRAEDWRTDTAERAPVQPAVPPPAWDSPSRPRYPLFADEAQTPPPGPAPTAPPASAAAETVLAPDVPEEPLVPLEYDDPEPRQGNHLLPWVLVALALLLVAGIGGFLLLGGDDDNAEDRGSADTTPSAGGKSSAPSAPPSDSDSPTPPPSSAPPPGDGKPRDVASDASARVPATAKPSRAVDGGVVRYDAANLFDGAADTAWRMPGDGAGQSIEITLGEPATLSKVGLINGYAKREPGYDGYQANRRITEVEWVFADGTTVPQTLREGVGMQTVKVDVTTDTVQLRILKVTRPAKGPAGRDYTAISEVSLVGVPA
ncbi:NADase-type glycan-binding domain-containing protein [Nocardioides sp. GXZ039]|uniref:NADase-type glycan-binding domain-containing protein n=1 Tax=Nocardioides sp. GXZ039 TaxID=3136018 RepID=UPI0030F387ED